MSAIKLIGIALHSDNLNEIILTICDNMNTHDESVFAACAHGLGHVARKFGVDVPEFRNELIKRSKKFPNSFFIQGAIVDMNDDVEYFVYASDE